MKLFAEKTHNRPTLHRPMPQPAPLEALESSLLSLRGQRAKLENQLATARSEETAAREEVSNLEDAILAGHADTGELQAARDRFADATRAIALILDPLATTKRLLERAQAMVTARSKEAEERKRHELDHRYRRLLRRAAPVLAEASILMTEIQVAYDAARELYRDARPGPPDLFFACSPIQAFTLCNGNTRSTDFLRALKKADSDSQCPETDAALLMADDWHREQAEATHRLDELAMRRIVPPRFFPALEALVSDKKPEPATPERTYRVVPAPDSGILPIPLFGR